MVSGLRKYLLITTGNRVEFCAVIVGLSFFRKKVVTNDANTKRIKNGFNLGFDNNGKDKLLIVKHGGQLYLEFIYCNSRLQRRRVLRIFIFLGCKNPARTSNRFASI